MTQWKTEITEATVNNAEIANGASETFVIPALSMAEMRRRGLPFGYNSISVVDVAGASAMTVRLNSGNNIQTLVLPSNGAVTVEPEDGEYWQEITILNSSGAAYAANKAFINRSLKVRNG